MLLIYPKFSLNADVVLDILIYIKGHEGYQESITFLDLFLQQVFTYSENIVLL